MRTAGKSKTDGGPPKKCENGSKTALGTLRDLIDRVLFAWYELGIHRVGSRLVWVGSSLAGGTSSATFGGVGLRFRCNADRPFQCSTTPNLRCGQLKVQFGSKTQYSKAAVVLPRVLLLIFPIFLVEDLSRAAEICSIQRGNICSC
jgi:hypothetical protein